MDDVLTMKDSKLVKKVSVRVEHPDGLVESREWLDVEVAWILDLESGQRVYNQITISKVVQSNKEG